MSTEQQKRPSIIATEDQKLKITTEEIIRQGETKNIVDFNLKNDDSENGSDVTSRNKNDKTLRIKYIKTKMRENKEISLLKDEKDRRYFKKEEKKEVKKEEKKEEQKEKKKSEDDIDKLLAKKRANPEGEKINKLIKQMGGDIILQNMDIILNEKKLLNENTEPLS